MRVAEGVEVEACVALADDESAATESQTLGIA
jgi:hypothetical protein